MERTAALRSVVDDVSDSDVPGDGGGVDGVHIDAPRTGVRSAASFSSWSFEEGRPEGA
jgi:hypothetical protein